MITLFEKGKQGISRGDGIAAAVFLLLLAGYLYNLTGWRIFDDEGEYLYQVWRMTLGEHPYRDFLTPQLPVYLYLGTAVMKITGPSLLAMRVYSLALAFGSAGLLYLLGRRNSHWLTGLLAASLFLTHSDVFKNTRIFRNEPLFIFLVTAGLFLATWSAERRRRMLAISGLLFSLATMVKLFGLLPIAGVSLWVTWQNWRDKRPARQLFLDLAYLLVPFLTGLGVIAAASLFISSQFFDFVLGHHLEQGSQLSWMEILTNKVGLYWEYVRLYPILVPAAFASAAIGLLNKDAREGWAWQLPTAGAFLLLSRQLGERHFMYLLPAFVLLAGWIIADSLRGNFGKWGRGLAIIALVLIILPSMRRNSDRASWRDVDTGRVVEYIDQTVEQGEYIVADDIGFAYYSRRPTTYSGAALSHGAVTSGQITAEILIDEIVEDNVQMVVIDESLLTGNHLVFLRDYPRFHRFLERNFDVKEKIRRDFQELALWSRAADSPWFEEDVIQVDQTDGTRFGKTAKLLGYSLDSTEVKAGDTLDFTLFWQVQETADNYWSVFTHLVDEKSQLVAQSDKVPYDGLYPPDRWWPEQVVDDDFSIDIPAQTPSGKYSLYIGMYDHLTGERLPLLTPAGAEIPDRQIKLALDIVIVNER